MIKRRRWTPPAAGAPLMLAVLGLALMVALGGCAPRQQALNTVGPRPVPTPKTPTPQPSTDDEAIRQLVLLEGQGLVSQDIAGLMDLWAEDAWIADAKHTPDDPADDARWQGRDAIRERYVVLVFPGNPQEAGATEMSISIEGDHATATATTRIGAEVSEGGDRWTFVRRDGRWWIESLTYNLEVTR